MDHAICYGPHRVLKKAVFPYTNSPLKKAETLDERYVNALVKDDKKEYFSIIKDPGFGRASARAIFDNDALQIGMAVLNGETEGIIEVQNNGMTPLHEAIYHGAPRLTKYLLHTGADIHAITYHLEKHNALDLALRFIGSYDENSTLYDILLTLCHDRREILEIIRLLVQSSQRPDYVRETFVKYTGNRQIAPLAALFLAAPEFFFSSYKRVTDLHDSGEMKLLLDIIDTVGDKLVAYIRLEQTSDQIIEQTQMEIAFLLHQVPRKKKLGVSSPDYFFRFFKPLTPQPHKQSSDDETVLPKRTWDDYSIGEEKPGPWMYSRLNWILNDNIDKADIYRWLPTLEPRDEGCLNGLIEKKLPSMYPFGSVFRDWQDSSFKQNVQSLPSANRMVDLKIASTQTQTWENKVMKLIKPTQTWENKVMKLIKPTQTWENKVTKLIKPKFNFLVMLSYFPTVAKRLIK